MPKNDKKWWTSTIATDNIKSKITDRQLTIKVNNDMFDLYA